MGVPLQQVLGAKNIIGIIQGIKPGLREKILPPALLTPSRKVSGNYGTYQKTVGERRAARTTAYGSPALVYEPTGVAEIPVNFIHSFQQIAFKPDTLMNLLAEGDETRQRLGMETVARQTADFTLTYRNLRVAAIMQLLATGKVQFDVNGIITNDATKVAHSVDMGIPATNKNQINLPRYDINGKVISSSIIDASWATAATSILTQLDTLRVAAVQLTGYPLELAFCGQNIKKYLMNNTEYKDYMKRYAPAQEAAYKGQIPAGFQDLTWIEMKESFFVQDLPNDGSSLTPNKALPLFDPDTVCFTPAIDPAWYELIEGSFPIPGGEEEGDNAEQLMGRMIEAFGHFGFAKRQDGGALLDGHTFTGTAWITNEDGAMILQRGPQHIDKLVLILGRHKDGPRYASRIGDVKHAMMGRAVISRQAGAIHGENHIQVLQRDVVNNAVVSTLKERGINCTDRSVPHGRHACRENDPMLLSDAHVEITVGLRFL